jgi:predicted MFS family arabinose efflux permease
MLALQLGGNRYAWDSVFIIALLAASAAFFLLFLLAERKAADPIIPFGLFKDRLFAASCAAAFFIGSAYIAAIVYVPIFVQGVFGGSATNAGMILTPMMLGSVAGSQAGGFLTTKTSFRNIMLLAAFFFVPGIFLLSTLDTETARLLITVYIALTGFGAGFSFSVLSLAAMHNFDFRWRGTASSINRFAITFGMTVGITVFGVIQRHSFANRLAAEIPDDGSLPGNVRRLLSPEGRNGLPTDVLHQAADGLSFSIGLTFLIAMVPAALAVIAITFMSNERVVASAKENQVKNSGT